MNCRTGLCFSFDHSINCQNNHFQQFCVGVTRAIKACVCVSFLQAGSSRVLYDLLPVVSFRGWPAVAQGWLTANHFWDGKITEEEAISGFYLLPCCSPLGGRPDREWRLAFSRSEVRRRHAVFSHARSINV